MKTAISVPDDIFEEAEHLAKRLKISRSELYAKAVSEYVSKHAPDAVTEALDRICSELGGGTDVTVQGAARRLLKNVEW
jgi:metal-responsive CopG/Arc/MetJ family transcriptional regulator